MSWLATLADPPTESQRHTMMNHNSTPRLWMPSRRQFLGGALASGVLVACGSSDSGSNFSSGSAAGSAAPDAAAIEPNTWTLVQRFPQGTQVPGTIRLPFSLSSGAADFIQDGPDSLGAQVTDLDGAPIGERITAIKRQISPAPYYDFRPTIDEVGIYQLVIDGGPDDGASFDVADPSEVIVAVPGDALEPFDTPTVDVPAGVDPVCTRDPICPFHTQTLTDALASGKAVAYYVGTPAFCQTGSCAPGLESIISVEPEYSNDIAFVHAEVWTDLTATTTTPAVDALGLTYEPALFVTDANGIIIERLDAVFDVTELRETLDRALA